MVIVGRWSFDKHETEDVEEETLKKLNLDDKYKLLSENKLTIVLFV